MGTREEMDKHNNRGTITAKFIRDDEGFNSEIYINASNVEIYLMIDKLFIALGQDRGGMTNALASYTAEHLMKHE